MSAYTEFFLGTPRSVVELELIDITHPSFLYDYFIVRNSITGVTVTREDASVQLYQFYPITCKPLGFKDDLDQGFSLTVGDTGDTLAQEIERVRKADNFRVKPKFVYRSYRSDTLGAPLYGPVVLEIARVTTAPEGASFEARAPRVNDGRTGEVYRLDRFPMLRGLL